MERALSASRFETRTPTFLSDAWLEPRFGAIALAIAGVVILAEWLPILFGGFWLDETFTYWQSFGGWQRAFLISSRTPGTSPLFSVLSSFFNKGPGPLMEFWLRLPDFLAMLAAAWLVYRLAGEWFGRKAGWMALVMFVSEKDIISRATEARPYGLAIACCAGAIYGLHGWLSRGRKSGWFWLVACEILVPYWHFLFIAFLAVPAAYITIHWLQGRKLPWAAIAATAALILIAWIPALRQVLVLSRNGQSLSFAAPPTLESLLEMLLPARFVVGAFLAFVAAQLVFDDSSAPLARGGSRRWLASLCVFWMFLGPLALFAAAKLKHLGLLVERYALYSVAGMVLFASACFSRLKSSAAQVAVLIAFAGVSLAGAASHHWKGPSMGSWREPLRRLAVVDPAGTAPAIISSGFVESNFEDWQHDTGWNSHLFAPLLVYPIRNRWYPLPYRLDSAAREYADRLLSGPLASSPRIVLMAAEPSDLTAWLTWKLEERHYRSHSESAGSVVLLVFDRPV